MKLIKYCTVFICLLISSGCSFSLFVNDETRLEIIYDAIEYLKNDKEESLLQIIDTIKINSIYGEQGYKYIFNKSKRVLNHCDVFNKDEIEIYKPIPIRTEYILKFCRDRDGNIVEESFDLIFSFHNYENKNTIHLIEILEHIKPKTPNVPPPVY